MYIVFTYSSCVVKLLTTPGTFTQQDKSSLMMNRLLQWNTAEITEIASSNNYDYIIKCLKYQVF